MMRVGGGQRAGVLMLLVLALVACGRAGAEVTLLPPATTTPLVAPTYAPIQFPRDEAPHDTLTEWWYYTGHLEADDGRQFGFEFVIFQTVRADFPVFYLGQFAITDRARNQFRHTSRVRQGSQIGRQDGLDLAIEDWRMRGARGQDHLEASMDNYRLSLDLRSQKPAALHDGDGLVSFGAAGDSYYYSHTRMTVSGTLLDHGAPLAVRGQAWFDHQWGNFLVLGGGWDWFSAQLDDGSELMLNLLRNDRDEVVGTWGSYVGPGGEVRTLDQEDFQIRSTGAWTSPHTGGRYPMGWDVSVREPAYALRFDPVLEDQEVVSEGSGLTYWEGANEIVGTRDGRPIRGQGYVELTGYAR